MVGTTTKILSSMISLIFLATWAQTPVPGPSDAPARSLRLGEEMRGELPAQVEAGGSAARLLFDLDLSSPGPVTITLDSLDFDARLEVEAPGKGVLGRDEDSGDTTNAWLVLDVADPSKLSIRASAQDGRSGEFVLLVREGRIKAPTGMERARRDADCARAAAERARERGEHERAARLFGLSSRAAYACGQIADARDAAEAEVAMAGACANQDLLLRAKIDLGGAERSLGNLIRACELLEGALGPARENLASASGGAAAAEAAQLLCFLCQHLGDIRRGLFGPREAIPFFREAVEVAPRTGRPDFQVALLGKLGEALDEIDEEKEAAAAIEKALSIASDIPDQPHVLADALLGRAGHMQRSGRPAEARDACEQALVLDAPGHRVSLLGTLANACLDLGRYERAQSAMDELERLCRASGEKVEVIPILQNRAKMATQLGDLPRARRLLEEALALQAASGSLDHRADLCGDLGVVLIREENFEEASERFDQALEASQATGDRAAEGRLLQNLGLLHEQRGDFETSLRKLEEAADIAEQYGQEALAAIARGGRGFALYRLGRYEEARPLALEAARKLEELGEPEAAIEAHETVALIELAFGDLASVEESLCTTDQLFEIQADPGIVRFGSAGLRSRFAKFGEIAQDLARERVRLVADPAGSRRAAREGWRQAGRWKGRVLLEGLKRRETPGSAGTGELVPRIGPRTALLEYADGLEALRAYLVVEKDVTLVDLGAKAPIEAAAREFVAALARHSMDVEGYERRASWLYERLIAPLRARLPDGIETLVVVPTPALAVLPFEALVLPAADSTQGGRARFTNLHYLIDDFDVVYAPSAPVLAELQKRTLRAREKRFLVAGDPIYRPEASSVPDRTDIAALRPSESIVHLERLKGTREESLAIAALLLRKDPSSSEAQKAELLDLWERRSTTFSTPHLELRLGADVRPSLFRESLLGYTHLHIAMHGHVDSEDPRHSGLVLSWDAGDQGFVPLEDVLDLDLDAELVVLSACDTAGGRVVRGEGVQSLASAFIEAGSRSVVASLWRIEDRDAAEFMKDFYERYQGSGIHPARALRSSKLEFRRLRDRGKGVANGDMGPEAATAHPYNWAAFVLIGVPPE